MTSAMSACSLDLENKNGPTDQQILTTRSGMITLSVGMRQTYSTTALESIVLTPGTTARELRGITTFTNIIEVDLGGVALPNFNGNILGLWQRPLRVMGMADDIIANAPTILAAEPGMLSGIMAHAKLFKAMSIGGMAQSFTYGATQTVKTGNVSFVSREVLLEEATTLLEDALQTVTVTAPSTDFSNLVTGADFSLINTINAYLARYSLMKGDYSRALSAAQAVNLTVPSKFTYTTQASNPIYQQLQVSKNYAPRDKFGLPPDLVEGGDQRLAFYFTDAATLFQSDPVDVLKGFATSLDAAIPVYLPDEMKLIIAESIIRSNGSLPDAIVQIDAVRTQTSGDPFNVHAGLPAYSGAVTAEALLTEIYKQRASELYLSGLRLEDSRRFDRPAPADTNPLPFSPERSRDFYPFPVQERQNNPNIPDDPAI